MFTGSVIPCVKKLFISVALLRLMDLHQTGKNRINTHGFHVGLL